MARHAVAEVVPQGRAVGVPWVKSSSPEKKQPMRPTATPTASGSAKRAPVRSVMPATRL